MRNLPATAHCELWGCKCPVRKGCVGIFERRRLFLKNCLVACCAGQLAVAWSLGLGVYLARSNSGEARVGQPVLREGADTRPLRPRITYMSTSDWLLLF